jgi:hypothetical protein
VRETAFCWGLNLSAGFNLPANSSVQLQGSYGKGMFPYSNDNFVNGQYDIAADGSINPLTYKAFLAALSHKWSPHWRSTIAYSTIMLDDLSPGSPIIYKKTQYALANLIWNPVPRLNTGIEVLYGTNQHQDDSKGSVTRVQVTVIYSLF